MPQTTQTTLVKINLNLPKRLNYPSALAGFSAQLLHDLVAHASPNISSELVIILAIIMAMTIFAVVIKKLID